MGSFLLVYTINPPCSENAKCAAPSRALDKFSCFGLFGYRNFVRSTGRRSPIGRHSDAAPRRNRAVRSRALAHASLPNAFKVGQSSSSCTCFEVFAIIILQPHVRPNCCRPPMPALQPPMVQQFPPRHMGDLQATTDQLTGDCQALQTTTATRNQGIAEVSQILQRAREGHGLSVTSATASQPPMVGCRLL